MPAQCLREFKESTHGGTFVTPSGDFIPQFGEHEIMAYTYARVLMRLEIQCAVALGFLFFVNRMAEAERLRCCEHGRFLLDFQIGRVELPRGAHKRIVCSTFGSFFFLRWMDWERL